MYYIVCVCVYVRVQYPQRCGCHSPHGGPSVTREDPGPLQQQLCSSPVCLQRHPKGSGTPRQVSLMAGPAKEGAGQPGCITAL